MTSLTLKSTPAKKSQKPSSNGAGRSTPETNLKDEAIQLRQAGMSLRRIAAQLNISHEGVRYLISGEPCQRIKVIREPKPQSPQVLALKLLAKDFSLHCLRLRRMMRKTQKQFGQLMGVGGNQVLAVSRWESGRHVPQKKYLLRFMALQKQFDAKPKRKAV